jgi:hypothetical protein
MRRKSKTRSQDALFVRGGPKEKEPKGDKKLKSKGWSKTLGKSKVNFLNYGKLGQIKNDFKRNKESYDASTEKSSNSSSLENRDDFT